MTIMTAGAPACVPEPNFHRWTGGDCILGRTVGVRIDDAAKGIFPDIEPGLYDILGISPGSAASPLIEAGVLSAEVYRQTLGEFEVESPEPEPPSEAFSLRVREGGVRIAARSREGFLNALNRLRLLAALRFPNCTIVDYPGFPIRAVRICPQRASDLDRMKSLARAVACLGYNRLLVATDACGPVSAKARASLERISTAFPQSIQWDSQMPADAIQDLDGPSTLDWEYAAIRGVRGACLSYRGDLRVEAMAGSGFLYNLAYSATMLWHRDYNNFSWEKVADATLSFMPTLVDLIRGEVPAEHADAVVDAFPVLSRPVKTGPSSTMVLGERIDTRADSVVFTHAIVPRASTEKAAMRGGSIGRYVIRYRNRRREVIPLTENVNIGRRDVWCGRRYDPLVSRFQTDPRLGSLSCFNLLRKKMGQGGKLEISFEYEWTNPHPEEPIDRILFEGPGAPGCPSIAVDQVVIVRRSPVS